MAPEQRNSRPDGEGPHRAHRDDEGADRVARRIRVAVEGEKHEHSSVSEDGQRGGHAGDSCEFHRRCIMSVMADLFFGYHMPNYTSAGAKGGEIFDRFLEQATAAEAAGFDLVTVMDHFYQIRGIGPETEPMMEAYTTLGAIAARTSRVKLATMVSGVTYRNPALLAKMVTTLDVISKGRAILGIGAAWNEDEHNGYGIEFPPIAQRMDRLDEALTIAKLMFTEERPTFEGKYYRIERALNVPRPIQPGGPKILVGGGGERRTLRLLAQHGDIGHWFGGNLEDLKRKKQVFEQHCADVN